MPTYQYACTECSHAFEQFQSFSDDSLTTCPECQGRLRKVFNAVGVVFKGSGFYRTDSRADARGGSSSTSTPAGGDKGSSGEKSGSSEKSTEKSGSSAKSGSSEKKAAPAAAASTGSSSSASSSSGSSSSD